MGQVDTGGEGALILTGGFTKAILAGLIVHTLMKDGYGVEVLIRDAVQIRTAAKDGLPTVRITVVEPER